MNNFRFLNFNNILNKKIYGEKPPRIFCGYRILQNASQYLTEEALDVFSDLKMEPYIFVMFQSGRKKREEKDSLIHSDIYYENGKWKDWHYGINLELYPAVSQFHWWKSKIPEKVYPDISLHTIPEYYYLNGVHYKKDMLDLLEVAEIDGTKPILARTDIPHSIHYEAKQFKRVAASLRFKQNRFSSWQEAYETIKI